MDDRLLVCGVGAGMDRSLVALRELGLELVVVVDRMTDRVREAAATALCADPADAMAVLRAWRAAELGPVDGVLSLGYDNPVVISSLAERFGLPGLPLSVAERCHFKDVRLAALSDAGLATPRFEAADTLDAAIAAVDAVGFPAVVKPVDRSNSVAVAKVEDRAGARAAAADALRASPAKRLVVEEFLEGSEHTVAGFAAEGRIWFTGVSDRAYDRKEEFAPHFFEEGDTLPSELDGELRDRVLSTVAAGVRALGIEGGVFNTDVLVTPGGEVLLIEVTCRLTGARIATEVVPLATGVDPLPNAVRLALGQPLVTEDFAPTRDRAVVQRYLPSPGGRVASVGRLDEIAARPGVYDVYWVSVPQPGQRLPAFRSADDIVAGVIATAATVPEAEAIAREALADVPLELVP